MLRAFSVAVVFLLASGCLTGPASNPGSGGSAQQPDGELIFDGARFATEAGDLTMVFYPEDAPLTVALYRDYLREGYFVGKEFGRIVPGHVIQILDTAGALGTTVTEDARRVPLEPSPRLNFSMGAVGISRSDDPNSGGPEFFIMDFATSHLWGNYTIFGQLVDGIEEVHAIARMPALETPRVHPAVNAFLSDRTALDPVGITAAEALQVTLTAEQAARMPARVGLNVREGDYRFSLEWPADLAAGKSSELVWFVRPYNNTEPLDPARLSMRVEGPSGEERPELRPHPLYPELLRWTWTPSAPGPHLAVLELDRQDEAPVAVLVER